MTPGRSGPICRVVLIVGMALYIAGCSGGPTTREGISVAADGGSAPPCDPPPAYDGQVMLPPGLDLPDTAVVTDVVDVPAGVVVSGYTEGDPSSLVVDFSERIAGAGLTVDLVDDELREAEVYFSGDTQGQVRLGRTNCPADSSAFAVIWSRP